ncbi:MAG: FkbM family methyltransferase [Minisyncoccia bacterium]
MSFVDRNNNPVNVEYEAEEQYLVRKYIPSDASVLELGARYGTVSHVISEVLNDPTRHVAVEPDHSVIEALMKNRNSNNDSFHIFEGVVSDKGYELAFIDPSYDFHEYGTYTKETDNPTVTSISLEKLSEKYNITFDCVVADCEGFFCDFVAENSDAIKNMRVIIYEQDGIPWSEYTKKYEVLDSTLISFGFKRIHTIPHPKYENNPHFHNVWVKEQNR